MDKDLVNGPIGNVGKYDVEFKGGKLVASVDVVAGVASASVKLELDAGQVLDALKKAIPGSIDDLIIDMAKAALLK